MVFQKFTFLLHFLIHILCSVSADSDKIGFFTNFFIIRKFDNKDTHLIQDYTSLTCTLTCTCTIHVHVQYMYSHVIFY